MDQLLRPRFPTHEPGLQIRQPILATQTSEVDPGLFTVANGFTLAFFLCQLLYIFRLLRSGGAEYLAFFTINKPYQNIMKIDPICLPVN